MIANEIDRRTIRGWSTGLCSNSSNPLYRPLEDQAHSCWPLFRTSLFSGLALFFAVICLVGCDGLATSGRSSDTSSANAVRIATAPSVGTVPSGYRASFTDTVQSPYGKIPTVANAFSVAIPIPRFVPSMVSSPAPLQITSDALPVGILENYYDAKLVATGGVPPYDWDAVTGQIAPGLTLRSSAGTISGIPFAAGTFSFTARVRDSTASSLSVTLSLDISDASSPAVPAVVPIRARLTAEPLSTFQDLPQRHLRPQTLEAPTRSVDVACR
jgi:hypothetical protein